MKQVFCLKSKPFSINSAYYDNRSKTVECREWAGQIFNQLWTSDNQAKLEQLRNYFDETKHSFKVSIKVVYPKEVFITQQGLLSSRTMDLSNTEKLLVDLFFDKAYFTQSNPYGTKNINHNDKHIIALYSSKTFHDAPEHLIYFTVKVVDRNF